MTHKELAETVAELSYKCFNSTPEKIAKIEKILRALDLDLLADVARKQGEANCGSEYQSYYEQDHSYISS